MAEQVIDQVCQQIGASDRRCMTRDMSLYGASNDHDHQSVYGEYGSDREAVLETIREEDHGQDLLHPDLSYVVGQVTWAMRCEMARTVEDVLARRTRALFLNAAASKSMAPVVAQIMAKYLNRDSTWIEKQVASFTSLASHYELQS